MVWMCMSYPSLATPIVPAILSRWCMPREKQMLRAAEGKTWKNPRCLSLFSSVDLRDTSCSSRLGSCRVAGTVLEKPDRPPPSS